MKLFEDMMPINPSIRAHYSRCFISAPFGMDLGVLPVLLGERQIAWSWSDNDEGVRFAPIIQRCDFAIAVLDGSQSDQRVLYEVGMAEGLGKPVLKIAASKRVGSLARSMFTLVEVKLSERDALAFHLDAFLSTPHETVFERDRSSNLTKPLEPRSPEVPAHQFHSQLETRVYDAILQAGGSAIMEPEADKAIHRNVEDLPGSLEIDLVLYNQQVNSSGLPFLPSLLIIECKNWEAPVNTATLRAFTSKLHGMRLKFGLLIAANGITGDAAEITAAHAHLRDTFKQDGEIVLVITRAELCGCSSTEDLGALLREKYGRFIMGMAAF